MDRRAFSGALSGGLLDPALAPLTAWTDAVLLIVRLIVGVVMIYYGWPKIKDPPQNARDFDRDGFRPGWLFGTLVLAAEFFGGFLVLLGAYVWAAAAAFGFATVMDKILKGTKPAASSTWPVLTRPSRLGLAVPGWLTILASHHQGVAGLWSSPNGLTRGGLAHLSPFGYDSPAMVSRAHEAWVRGALTRGGSPYSVYWFAGVRMLRRRTASIRKHRR